MDDCRWLVSPDASRYLAEAEGAAVTVGLAQRLRRALTPGQAALVLDQVELRRRAQDKFAQAKVMFLTRRLLEQATEERLAHYKAARFTQGATLIDVCCGIGGDLMGLVGRGNVLGIDRDESATILAEANCRANGLTQAQTQVADAESISMDSYAAWHVDPDRRAHGHRTTQFDSFEPTEEVVDRWLRECPAGAVKLAPATVVSDTWSRCAELEWLGSRRECRQQVAWFGDLAQFPAARRATVVDAMGHFASVCGPPHQPVHLVSQVQRYLLEPHAAVLAAQLTGVLAARHRLSTIDERIAYLTSDQPVADPLLACFEVFEVLPFDGRRLRAVLTARRIGNLEIKTRGVELDPHSLRKRLALKGDESATLVIARFGTGTLAILAHRLTSDC